MRRTFFLTWLLTVCFLSFATPLPAQDSTAEDTPAAESSDEAEPTDDTETTGEDPVPAAEPATDTDSAEGDEASPAEDAAAGEDETADDATPADEPAEDPADAPDQEANVSSDVPAVADDAGGTAAERFAQVFDEWKQLLTELRDIHTEYQEAEESELDAIRERWDAKLAEGHAMIPLVRERAVAAFKESPNTDRELSRFLVKLLDDDIRADKYESANELAAILIGAGNTEREVNNLAGIAAFGVNDFETAGKHLNEADAAGTLTTQGTNLLNNLRDYPDLKELWGEEQKLREAETAAGDLPQVKLQTSAGDIVVELFENEAPETVGNFVGLVDKGFYNGLIFHRVMQGFMAQGGCPNGDGMGDPGYKIYCECVKDNHRNHFCGSLSMAKTAARNTGGSQFFINLVATPHLNGDHTVFGRVIDGMDAVTRIVKRDPEGADAASPTMIVTAEVLRKREHEYVPNKVQ